MYNTLLLNHIRDLLGREAATVNTSVWRLNRFDYKIWIHLETSLSPLEFDSLAVTWSFFF